MSGATLRFRSRTFLLKTEKGVSRARLSRDCKTIVTEEWGDLAVGDCVPEGPWMSPVVVIPEEEATRSDVNFLARLGVRVSVIAPAPPWLQDLVEVSGAIVYSAAPGFRTVSVYLPDPGCFFTSTPRGLSDFLRRPDRARGLLNGVDRRARRRAAGVALEPFVNSSGEVGLGVVLE